MKESKAVVSYWIDPSAQAPVSSALGYMGSDVVEEFSSRRLAWLSWPRPS